jgi:hypothetical protein
VNHIGGNYHMADGVIVHVPASNLLVEADLSTQNWDFNWWGDSLMNSRAARYQYNRPLPPVSN